MWWYVYVIMSFYVIPFLRFSSWITLQGVAHVYPFLTNKHCGELHKRVASIPVGGFVWRVGFGAERSARSVEWLGARGQGEDSGIPMDSHQNLKFAASICGCPTLSATGSEDHDDCHRLLQNWHLGQSWKCLGKARWKKHLGSLRQKRKNTNFRMKILWNDQTIQYMLYM